MVKNNFRTKFFREMAVKGSVSSSTAGTSLLAKAELLNFTDWIPMLWHTKGYSIVVNSVYLETKQPLKSGTNADRRKEIG
eukprot:493353-Pyramimonas_sp.AAC.1